MATTTIEVGGTRLAVTLHGSGPDVLLIHGTGPAAWGQLPERLAPHARVIAYDRRSFGDSAGEPLRDLTRHAEDAAALLEALDAGPAVVVGWSNGGLIALELAVRDRDRVAGLVLLEPPYLLKRHPTRAMLGAILGAKVRGAVGRPRAGAERFLRFAASRRDGTNELERLGPEFRAAVHRCAPAMVRELDAGTGEHIDQDALRRLDVPTVVIRGTESAPEFEGAARRVIGLVPGAELVVAPGSGHVVPMDAADLVAGHAHRLLAGPAPAA